MENEQQSSDKDKIAARLKDARKLSGLSQSSAADKLGLKRPAISEIEAGNRKVSAEEIIQFAALYKVDASWLLQGEDPAAMGQLKFAARELEKLKPEEREKLMQFLTFLPKKK